MVRAVLLTLLVGLAMGQQERLPVSSLLRKTLRGAGRNRGGQKICKGQCPRIYNPVCGSDGNMYSNLCVLEYYACIHGNITHTPGLCGASSGGGSRRPCPVACPYNYAPVCGTDGVTYPNPCTLDAAACKDTSIALAYSGLCEEQRVQESDTPRSCPQVCTFEYAPVCGSDGNSYASRCIFQTAACTNPTLTIVHDGVCGAASLPRPVCPSSCSGKYEPVCGSDGNTYGNRCTLELVSCRDNSITLARLGGCGTAFNTCPDVCPEVEEPVCGSDGRTYKNQCVFRAATCDDTSETVTSTAGECANPPQSSCPVLCPAAYKPVCGTDGKTYPNECVLETEACYDRTLAIQSQGECDNDSDQTTQNQPPTRAFIPPPQPQPPQRPAAAIPTTTAAPSTFTLLPARFHCVDSCGRVFNPVCASDGQTYFNRCLMGLIGCRERRNVFVVHSGRCDPFFVQ